MNKLNRLLLPLLLMVGITAHAQDVRAKIEGEWLSAKKDARVAIYEQGGKYYGKLVWGTGGDSKDIHNPNPKMRARDVVGITLLSNFEYVGNGAWAGGTIYDPREGKTYDCKMQLEGADRLKIRGYLGVSLFGRTEIWTRK